MNDQDRLEELEARLRRIRLAAPDADLIELLSAELQKSHSEEKTLYVYSLLAKELQAHGRYREAEAAIRASIQVQPLKPDSWITLALHHLYHTCQLEEALSTQSGIVTIAYDNRERVSSLTDAFGQVVSYAYDANSNRTQLSLNAATSATYQYDVVNRLTKLTDGGSFFIWTRIVS